MAYTEGIAEKPGIDSGNPAIRAMKPKLQSDPQSTFLQPCLGKQQLPAPASGCGSLWHLCMP
jgi:hypothetical protein